MTDTLQNADIGRLSDKLANREANAPLVKAYDMLTVAEIEKTLQQINNVEARTLVRTLANT